MSDKAVDFDYAVIRWVPSVARQEFRNVGVVLHAPSAQFLEARIAFPAEASSRLRSYLGNLERIVRGESGAGPIAQLNRSERFHWVAAPRSDSIQTSTCHPGRAPSGELSETLEAIFAWTVCR